MTNAQRERHTILYYTSRFVRRVVRCVYALPLSGPSPCDYSPLPARAPSVFQRPRATALADPNVASCHHSTRSRVTRRTQLIVTVYRVSEKMCVVQIYRA